MGKDERCPEFKEQSFHKDVEMQDVRSPVSKELSAVVATRVAQSASRKAEREVALQRRELKGKSVCPEDSMARRSARQAKSISKFFQSSRNTSNPQPLLLVSDSTPSDPSHTSSQSVSFNLVSLDTEVLPTEAPNMSQIGSSSGGEFEAVGGHELHRHLREDTVQISDGEEEMETDDDIQELVAPVPKKSKVNYDRTRRFQNEWAAKLVWAEPIRGIDGSVHLVKCTICSTFEKSPKILGPKWDTLTKHEGRKKAAFDMSKYKVKAGEWYISKASQHQINLRLFAAKQPISVLQQMNTTTSMARSKKIVQLCTIFQILSAGRPMLEYEERQGLYAFLNVPNLPRMHWTNSSGWKMADYMYSQVKEAIKKKINVAHFIALTCDEVTTMDNGSWICIHVYVVENYVRIPHLISLQRLVDGSGANSLTILIMKALECGGDLTFEQISRRLTCFGADGVSTFQGLRRGVTMQIQTKFAPFCTGVHCMAHRCNLAARSLSTLPIFAVVEQVIQKTHSYFSKSPKRLSEYQKLAEVMETKGLKPLLQVSTKWMSLLEPVRRLLADYRTLLAKMKEDVGKNEAAKTMLSRLASE